MIEILVHGVPVPKQSFRISGHGGYRDPRVTAWQSTVAMATLLWMQNHLLQIKRPLFGSGSIDLSLDFYLPDRRRVDLDNLSKAVLDALNGYLWADDRQIVRMVLTKVAGVGKHAAGVLIKVQEI
jgi:Holliday junction resolvase RusA-like endonuclease